jgi:hypothetical protein
MLIKVAEENFLGINGRKKLNCAQAVIAAFKNKFDSQCDISVFVNQGGGNAPDGFCGAYYAALCLLEQSRIQKKQDLQNFFKNEIGFDTCKEIKAAKISCLTCVKKTAEFLAKV